MDAHQAPVAERDRGIAVSHEAAVHSQQVWQQPNNSHARIEVPAPSVQRLRHSKKRKKVENFSLVQFSNLLTKPNFDFYISATGGVYSSTVREAVGATHC